MGTGLNGRSGLRLGKELLWIQGLKHAHCATQPGLQACVMNQWGHRGHHWWPQSAHCAHVMALEAASQAQWNPCTRLAFHRPATDELMVMLLSKKAKS
jgi:hypothetical protein